MRFKTGFAAQQGAELAGSVALDADHPVSIFQVINELVGLERSDLFKAEGSNPVVFSLQLLGRLHYRPH